METNKKQQEKERLNILSGMVEYVHDLQLDFPEEYELVRRGEPPIGYHNS